MGKVELITETTYKTDSTGSTGEQDSCCLATVKYDEKGYCAAYNFNNMAGTEKDQSVYFHDDKGSFTGEKYTENGKPVSSSTIKVENGKISGLQEFDSANKMTFYYTDVTLNDYERRTGYKQYKPDSTLNSSGTSTYDKQFYTGTIVKDSSGKEIYSSTAKRDDKNNMIEYTEKIITKDSTINKTTKYRYDSFDDKGNWTQRTKMDGTGKPVEIVKRTIAYYKE